MTENISEAKPTLPSTTQEQNAREKQQQEQEAQQQQEQHDQQRAQEPKQLDDLHTEHGDTTIADQVVEKIAGIATRQVSGVYAMGSAAGRALSNLTSKLSASRSPVSSGVSIEKGERQTAVEVSVVVDYGVSIVEVSDNIRQSVIDGVEHATGLEVVEVNINVTDVHLPEEDSADEQGTTHEGNNRPSERLA
ncbi:MAG: Asp23/Gls24 family envelope stress response protein [Terracoccus sp.]